MIEVFMPGSPVLLEDKLPAIVTQICIKDKKNIQYQCVWWSGRERKCEWLEQIEVRSAGDRSASMKVGFTK